MYPWNGAHNSLTVLSDDGRIRWDWIIHHKLPSSSAIARFVNPVKDNVDNIDGKNGESHRARTITTM